MSFDYITCKENENILPVEIKCKKDLYQDLMYLEHSFTGLVEAQIANMFMRESVQLIINSIALFEKGYFDCSFYSLRQSLELSTTMVYLVDNDEKIKKEKYKQWKSQERFPQFNQILDYYNKNEYVFSDIKHKMRKYFDELQSIKTKMNKYIHKQGFNTFYTYMLGHPLRDESKKELFIDKYLSCVKKSIGAVAILRLSIDPFPILLNDDSIYRRTPDLMTEPYSENFINEYIGFENIELYKMTDLYRGYYDGIIEGEAQNDAVSALVKDNYIDVDKFDEIVTQKHLLKFNDLTAVFLAMQSHKNTCVYCCGGLIQYFTSRKSNRINMSFDSRFFNKCEKNIMQFNLIYDEAFISWLKIYDEIFFIEHNEQFSVLEIQSLKAIEQLYISMNKSKNSGSIF